MRTIHDNLPEHLALFQVFVRRTSLAQWKDPIDHWFQPPGKYMAENFMQLAHGSHIGAQQSQLPREQMPQINTDARSSRSAAGHQRTSALKRLHTLIPGRRPDVLDHDVRSLFVCNLSHFVGYLLFV